jgi:ribosome biogenesis GTPase
MGIIGDLVGRPDPCSTSRVTGTSEASGTGLVVCARSGFFEVELSGRVRICRMRGRLKQGRRTTDLAVVGDRVRISEDGEGGTIEEVLPRSSVFSRLAAGSRRAVEDVLAANLDGLWICSAASAPPLRPRLVDRFLVIAEWNGLRPTIVLTKADLPDEEPEEVAAWCADWEAAGYPVRRTSAETGQGVEALRAMLSGRTVALVGPSGAGKSRLLSAIEPSIETGVAALGAAQKGAHTTRVARLFSAHGGRIADTPGIRELAPFALPAEVLGSTFPELRAASAGCQFRDCRHDGERGCAVRPAASAGQLSARRFDSYLRQLHGEG